MSLLHGIILWHITWAMYQWAKLHTKSMLKKRNVSISMFMGIVKSITAENFWIWSSMPLCSECWREDTSMVWEHHRHTVNCSPWLMHSFGISPDVLVGHLHSSLGSFSTVIIFDCLEISDTPKGMPYSTLLASPRASSSTLYHLTSLPGVSYAWEWRGC